jgi:hypothetical protein
VIINNSLNYTDMEAEKTYQNKVLRTIQQKRGGEGALEFADNRQNKQCIQLFSMDSNGLVGSVSIDQEEGGAHNGHTLSRHLISEEMARNRLITTPYLNAVSFWRTHDDAHEAFRKVFAGRDNRGLKYWAGKTDYDPVQTRIRVSNIGGGYIIHRANIEGIERTQNAEGYVWKSNNNPFTALHPSKQLGLVTLYPV